MYDNHLVSLNSVIRKKVYRVLICRHPASVITFLAKTNKRELHAGARGCSHPQWFATNISPKAVPDFWAGSPVKGV